MGEDTNKPLRDSARRESPFVIVPHHLQISNPLFQFHAQSMHWSRI